MEIRLINSAWVHYHMYELHESLEEMIDQQPHAEKFIIIMDILMSDAEEEDDPFEENGFIRNTENLLWDLQKAETELWKDNTENA